MASDTAIDSDSDTAIDGAIDRAEVAHARATVHPGKAAAVTELTASLRSSSATVLTNYRGLTVKQVTALRVALGADTTYAVVKNTLTRRAVTEAGLDELQGHLTGPTAIAFVNGDPVEAAKGLRDFAKANPALVIKGGVLDGKLLSAAEINTFADLESREVLLARLAGAMKASLSGAASLLAAPLSQTARLAQALVVKAEQDPSVIGGAGQALDQTPPVQDEAPAAQPPAEATPVSEQPSTTD